MTLRRQYRVINPLDMVDLTNQLNAALQQISDRIDEIEGFRGSPTVETVLNLKGGAQVKDSDTGDIIHGFLKS